MGDLLMVTHSRAQSHWWCLWGALAHVQTPAGRTAGRALGGSFGWVQLAGCGSGSFHDSALMAMHTTGITGRCHVVKSTLYP